MSCTSAVRHLLLLLLLLLAERRCVASPLSAELSGPPTVDRASQQLLETLGREVRSAVVEVTSEPDGSLSGLQVQLTQLAETLSGLQEAQNVTHQRQLQALETGVASVQSRLESRLEGVQAQLDTKLERIQSQLEFIIEKVSPGRSANRDCSDLAPDLHDGVYLLQLPGLEEPTRAFCDQQTAGGGWTVFQRRSDLQPRQDFFLGWEAYRRGFGFLDAEFWWGLEYLHLTTSVLDRRYELRIDLEDFDGEKRFALYQDFRISSEADGYRLYFTNYSGDAGDSLIYHQGMAFSTKDRDQDADTSGSCAEINKGAWWYSNCHESHLNGRYLSGGHTELPDGISWSAWSHYSLKSADMKLRPAKTT